jgi:hypothetical protein
MTTRRERGGSCCGPHEPDWASRFAGQGQLALRSERVGENAFLDTVWPVRGETQLDATAVRMPNNRRPSDAAIIQGRCEAIQDVLEAPNLPPLRQSEEVWDENSRPFGEETAKRKIRPGLHGEGVQDHDRRTVADIDAAQRLRSRHTACLCPRSHGAG